MRIKLLKLYLTHNLKSHKNPSRNKQSQHQAGNIFSTEKSYKAIRNAASTPPCRLANMPQKRSEVDLHGFSLHDPLASLPGLPISFSCDSVFSNVANCRQWIGLGPPNYFARRPGSEQFSFPLMGLLGRFTCSLNVCTLRWIHWFTVWNNRNVLCSVSRLQCWYTFYNITAHAVFRGVTTGIQSGPQRPCETL